MGRKHQFFRFLIDVGRKPWKSKDWCWQVENPDQCPLNSVRTIGASGSKELARQSRGSSMCPAKGLHILGYNTHPKLRLHEQPCINVSFSIFCSLDLQSLQTWLSVAAMIKKTLPAKTNNQTRQFFFKAFHHAFQFFGLLPDVKRLWSVSSQKKKYIDHTCNQSCSKVRWNDCW